MNSIQKALGLTLMSTLMFSCSNNDDLGSATNPNPQVSAESTHVNFSINVPGLGAANTRAGDSWAGRDEIQVIDLFLVNLSTGNVDHNAIPNTDFTITGNTISPKNAIEVTSGEEIKAYVLVNSPEALIQELKAKNALELDQAFNAGETSFLLNGANNYKDVVTMTNQSAPQAISIAPSITAEEALKGANKIKVSVLRVVSRGIVTLADESLKSTVSLETKGGKSVDVKITELFYSVGQGNSSYKLMQDVNNATPSFDWKPTSFDDWKEQAVSKYSPMTETLDVLVADKDINTTLLKEEGAAFVLPVTHADGNYVKGNTTYFDVQVKFYPTDIVEEENPDGDAHYGAITNKFYNSLAAAKAENSEYVTTYKDYIMHYIVWLNPDEIEGKAVNSPTHRNTAYRANIKSFKKMGYPVNPLDPKNPIDPTDPINPVDPTEPLEVVNSFLSVDINVVDWGIIDNDVNL
ncbi:Mfa1 family fimbria major subunit [Bacteroides propionicifaciens]|uniref:Mfa1 family fimbria major subunit n=1 Tax=Bacteroides propionicifaciens TaxID=392838 RepID=UPI0003750C42|nr:Mfa1 family fimbria major subunit [Bacteroides propionicifaciens]